MGVLEDLRRYFAPNTSEPGRPMTGVEMTKVAQADAWRRSREERVQARSVGQLNDFPDLTTQLLAVQGIVNRPWHGRSVNEALSVPSLYRSVTLISNTTGSLGIEAYRKGVLLSDERTPQLIKRPDPLRIPRDFYRDTAWYMATRGEAWWWVPKRDGDGNALALVVVPPWEVKVDPNPKDRLRPTIKWLDKEYRREDMRQITLGTPEGYRGAGPLQRCGAAVSVGVEAQIWAANFYASGNPNFLIKAVGSLSEDPETAKHEADTLRDQIMGRDPNTPMVIDSGIEDVKDFPVDPQGAQMLDARESVKGDSANMFGVPGALLEYGRPGSSLTYQNVTEVFTTFVKSCLGPDYLEAIEQHMGDLLPRSTTARFNVEGFLRADVKTRYEVYQIGIDSGILTPEMAQRKEGLIAGNVEFAPVPFAPPAADPPAIPQLRSLPDPIRCDGMRLLRGLLKPCHKLLAEQGPYVGTCPRCGKRYEAVA